MPTDFEVLLGMELSGPEDTKAMARQLRREQRHGMLGMLGGNERIAPVGQAIYGQATDKAKTMGLARAKKAYQEKMFGMQEQQMDRADTRTLESREFTRGENVLNRDLNRDLAEIRAQTTRTRETKDMWRYRQALSRDLTKAGIPEMNAAITIVDEALAPYEGKNLPGFGGGKYDMRQEARTMRGKLAGISNVLLKARSGAAVTEPEFERFKKELLGEGVLATDADFRRSWAELKQKIAAHEDGIVKGYDPSVQELYYSDVSMPLGMGVSSSTSVSGPAFRMGDPESYF